MLHKTTYHSQKAESNVQRIPILESSDPEYKVTMVIYFKT